jgi:hypothetical protein
LIKVNGLIQCNPCDSTNIPNCNKCTNSVCSQCIIGSLLQTTDQNINICTVCSTLMSNCKTCSDKQFCTACYDGYFLSLDQSSCIACTTWNQLCGTCISSTVCTGCISPIASGLI